MATSNKLFVQIACSLLITFVSGLGVTVSAQEKSAHDISARDEDKDKDKDKDKSDATALIAELPDSPGATLAKSSPKAKQSVDTTGTLDARPAQPVLEAIAAAPEDHADASQTADPMQTETSSSRATSASPQIPDKPVGTAAAGVIPASGIAASQPAGVAIAPAKQHRVRTIVLRTGAIIGAGVAVGSVVVLTEATPSKPPGAH